MAPVSPALSTYRVLIVDDNEGIHHDFRTLLQPRRGPDELDELAAEIFGEGAVTDPPIVELPSYRCDSAFQGSSAVETVKDAVANGDAYALAFIDIRMPPGLDGVETILHLWEIDPNIQMVLCSAYSDYSWEQIVQKLGVSDKLLLLRKPFDANSVKQLTLATTSRWQRERAVREQLRELEQRLARCHTQLTALEDDIARSGMALGEASDVRVALDDLTQLLDRLATEGLKPQQAELVARARDVAASLRAVLHGSSTRSGGAR